MIGGIPQRDEYKRREDGFCGFLLMLPKNGSGKG